MFETVLLRNRIQPVSDILSMATPADPRGEENVTFANFGR